MKYPVTAVTLIAVVAVSSLIVTGELTASAALAHQYSLVLQLEWLQSLIERIDQFLEAVVDLLNTLRQLFGGEGGG